MDQEMSRVKKTLIITAWCFMMMQFAGFAVVTVTTWFRYSEEWWSFFSTKLPFMWANLLAPAAVILLLEFVSKGNTVDAIMDINKDSPWQHKLVAVLFLLGLAGIGAYVGKTI